MVDNEESSVTQDSVEILGTGQIEEVIIKETVLEATAQPRRSVRPNINPPPTPETALLPDVIYYPLYVGKKPAVTVQDAVKALSFDTRFEDMMPFDRPQIGVYCLARPTTPHRATATDPHGPEVTIAYLEAGKGQKDVPQVWLRSVFTAYANEQSIGEITQLRKEKAIEHKKGWARTAVGAGVGMGAILIAIATTWTYKGLDDSNRYASMNKATADERLTLAKTELERVGAQYKTLEDQLQSELQRLNLAVNSLQNQANDIQKQAESVDVRVGLVQFDLTNARAQADSIWGDLAFMQEATISGIWDNLNQIEDKTKIASEDLASREAQIQSYRNTLDAWDQLPARVTHFGRMLHARFPAYLVGSQLLGKMNQSITNMNALSLSYLGEIRNLTDAQLRSSVLMRLDGADAPALYSGVDEWASFKAKFTNAPTNPNVKYNGTEIRITAGSCDEAVAVLGNVLGIPQPLQTKFQEKVKGECSTSGQDIRTGNSFSGYYTFGTK